jgi:type II secretory pathway component PulJ
MQIKIKSAFTLVEAMVTVLLFALVIGGIYTTVLVGNVSWQNYEAVVTVQQEARRAVAFLARDLRTAKNLKINSSAEGLVASFFHPQDGEVRYSWLRQGATAGQLFRQNTAGSRIIGQNISALSIVESKDAIAFSVVASRISRQGKEVSFALTHRVGKR